MGKSNHFAELMDEFRKLNKLDEFDTFYELKDKLDKLEW